VEIERLRREDARWKILQVVDAGRPVGVNESIIRRVLGDVELPIPRDEVRRDLTYLRDLGLIELGGEDEAEWFAKATPAGIAVIEFTAPAPAGIARPAKSRREG
jgi:hypothetical protein